MSSNRTSLPDSDRDTKSSRFQCALLSVKAAANIQTFFLTKQIKIKVFFKPFLRNHTKNLPRLFAENREAKIPPFSFIKQAFFKLYFLAPPKDINNL